MILTGKYGGGFMSQGQIHDRILEEIKNVKSHNKMKIFLKKILEFEAAIIDKGRPIFKPDFERILNEVFYK